MPSTQGGAGQPASFPASPLHAVARKPKGYTSIISILAGRLSNWSLDVRVLLPKISLKRRERDAVLVGRMVEGGLCPQRVAVSKSQNCNRGGGGEDPRWGRKWAAVYSFPRFFLIFSFLI